MAEPNIESLVSLFHEIEKNSQSGFNIADVLLKELTPQSHADSLKSMIMQG